MYIRRKVFSQTMDWDNGYDEMEERLYSTGDYELDEILERAFCEGYEAAQREFADDSYDELIGAGIGAGAVGLGAAGAYGYHKGSNALIKNRIEAIGKKEGLTKAEIKKRQNAWENGKLAKSDAWLAKHLGKGGTVANKVSGWAEKAIEKMGPKKIDADKLNELITKYKKNGLTQSAAKEKAMKKLSDGKIMTKAKKAGTWVAEKVKNNPRAAAAAAAGIAAAGIGAGAGYAHRKMNED